MNSQSPLANIITLLSSTKCVISFKLSFAILKFFSFTESCVISPDKYEAEQIEVPLSTSKQRLKSLEKQLNIEQKV